MPPIKYADSLSTLKAIRGELNKVLNKVGIKMLDPNSIATLEIHITYSDLHI